MTEQISLAPGLIIAAPRSGAGKTTVTLGLLRALKRRGVRVQPFKCGPDYIDPAFHEKAAGTTSFNVDSWAMTWPLAARLLGLANERHCDIAVAEALMGLFDGVTTEGAWGNGASADLAARTGWPVILVLDVSGQSQTAAAVARGFRGFRSGVEIAGVVLNRCGSDRHVRLARAALDAHGIQVLGALPRDTSIGLPERHLGLVQAEETQELEKTLDGLADFVEQHLDVAGVLAHARKGSLGAMPSLKSTPPGQRIALARDAAFSFVYPHVIASWRNAGAEIYPFSPLADEGPRDDADVLWLPGGYPELHAGKLASASNFRAKASRFAEMRPVHGECGGYMVLGHGLIDAQGCRHEMLGLLGLECSFAERRLHLGYRRARLLSDCCLGTNGMVIRGHEFHYATILSVQDTPLFAVEDADGKPLAEGGSRRLKTTGSFFHAIDVCV